MENNYVNLNRLEFLVTYRCSSRCIHCCNADDGRGSPACIDKTIAVNAVAEIGARYKLDSLMTFGGEPMLYPDVVCAIHETAASIGVPERQIITNACWTKDPQEIRETARTLAASGVNHIMISVDAFHQKFLPLETVEITAKALLDSGIVNLKWNPCWLVSEDADNGYNRETRAILSRLSKLDIPVGGGNVVVPDGRAAITLSEYFPSTKPFTEKYCQDMPYTDPLDDIRSICIEPDGGMPICSRFSLGSIADASAVTLLESYDPYSIPELKDILEHGVPRRPGFRTLCDMCCASETLKR